MHAKNGRTCVVHWRCSAYAKFRCRANLKTRGKMLVALRGAHTHPAKNVQRSCSPIVYKQVSKACCCECQSSNCYNTTTTNEAKNYFRQQKATQIVDDVLS